MITEQQILNAKILIVDDDERVSSRLEGALRSRGHAFVRTTTDPTSVAHIYVEERPDIVLLDLAMPVMDGFGVLDELSVIESGSYVPVLMLVEAEADEQSRLRALASPAKDILTKPIDLYEAYLRICNLLEVRVLYAQLAASKHELESVLDVTDEAIAMFDRHGHLEFVNRQFGETFGIHTGLAPGVSTSYVREQIRSRFREPETFDKTDAAFFEDVLGTAADVVELVGPPPKQLYRYTRPVTDDDDTLLGRLVAYRDVSKDAEVEMMKVEVARLRADLEAEYGFDTIITSSHKMRQVFELMRSTLDNDITVLVQGESGTGKELVAKAIHVNSPRRKGPFITVNCAAIPDTLIESELFGHERGAFTGAVARRIGRFEQADGGTIFLDEIGEMNTMAQAKLLRVLEDRTVQRVGGTASVPVNVRVIAATNRDLRAAADDDDFRDDLYYRVAVFPIFLPPLRDRPEDIPVLADHFLARYAESMGKRISGIAPETMQSLLDYPWPGNVRQLENVLQRAVVLETQDQIQLRSLASEIQSTHPQQDGGGLATTEDVSPTSLEESERRTILRALKSTDHNVQKAARILGVNRTTLYRKLRKYDIADGYKSVEPETD